jgi:transcriptional regulator with XRE-family HTH domain
MRNEPARNDHLDDPPRWTLGDRIRKAREHRGWTQRELSTHLGVSLRTISRWERGDNLPGTTRLVAVARETGVPLGWLVDGDGHGAT